jgi:hypothetical protein
MASSAPAWMAQPSMASIQGMREKAQLAVDQVALDERFAPIAAAHFGGCTRPHVEQVGRHIHVSRIARGGAAATAADQTACPPVDASRTRRAERARRIGRNCWMLLYEFQVLSWDLPWAAESSERRRADQLGFDRANPLCVSAVSLLSGL